MSVHAWIAGLAASALLAALPQTGGRGTDAPASTAAPHWPLGAVVQTWVDPEDMPAGADELVGRAAKTWTSAAGGRLSLQITPAESRARMRVHFIRSTTRYGETLPQVDRRTGEIVGAEIGIVVAGQGDTLDRRIITYLTALHEIGHALGLPHRDDFSSIMYLFRYPTDGERFFGRYRSRLRSADDIGSASATGLFPQDVEALKMLYER